MYAQKTGGDASYQGEHGVSFMDGSSCRGGKEKLRKRKGVYAEEEKDVLEMKRPSGSTFARGTDVIKEKRLDAESITCLIT